jgi:HTH-type transcriptional regulator/antitoxin HigA
MTTRHHILVDHPGVYIAEELEARGWLQTDLAFVLGTSSQTVNQIINGKRGISANMAKALANAFDVSPELFMSLQQQYELSCAEDADESIYTRARVQDLYPLYEMIKRGWIEDTEPHLMETQIARFFEVDDVMEVPYLSHAARKTNYDDIEPVELAWLFRVKQIAKEMVVPRFNRNALEHAVESMKALLVAPEETRHVPRFLQECGVRFVVVESLPGSKIDGVCFWLDKNAPVIGMSLRFDRIDNFWFVLRHEIEHVLNGDGKKKPIVDPNATDIPQEEVRANTAAGNFCIPPEEMYSFFHRKNPYFSRRDVVAFARRIKVHPGLIVGQLHYRTQRYSILRDMLVKTRPYITTSALVDGWGEVVPVNL